MRVALVGAELEENLGLRYMASALEQAGHEVRIVPFNYERETSKAVGEILEFNPEISGLSMVFTGRAREFCGLAETLRRHDYRGHVIAGGHFACLNAERLLTDFPAFDSVGLGEGEEIICALAENLDRLDRVRGICYRRPDWTVKRNRSKGNPEHLDALPFPKRTSFHDYFGKPIASLLSSRGCWRDCAFCSINAWYKQGGGKKFRIRSIESIVAEMKSLYFEHGIRIFNMQDDNFFLPHKGQAVRRFEELRAALDREGVQGIAIAVKARPDSITNESIAVLDELGLFRVFLGVENASQSALEKLNRKCRVEEILSALEILNNYDVHIAYNLLMFELDTTMDEILVNLRFMERHTENPFNFCRAEAYAGTGLEAKLIAEDRILGDYFGIDYRLRDPHAEAFHQIANYAFYDRNFSESGLHYFNMQVDFFFQILRRFHPSLLSQSLRGAVRNFIKLTNLDTYECLCQIYDFVSTADPADQSLVCDFSYALRDRVDGKSHELRVEGERILDWMSALHEGRAPQPVPRRHYGQRPSGMPAPGYPEPYLGLDALGSAREHGMIDDLSLLNLTASPIPYAVFKRQLDS